MARSKHRSLPAEPVTVRIEGADSSGFGNATVDGRSLRVHGALDGELVTFRYTMMRRDRAEGVVVEVLEASPDRVVVACPQFGTCGGCSLQHQSRAAQVRDKQRSLFSLLAQHGAGEPARELPPLLDESSWGYRRKARLGVKYVPKKGRVLVGFRERGSGFICETSHCPVLDPAIGERLLPLAGMIERLSIRDRIPQIEVAIDDHHCLLVFRLLAEATAEDLALIAEFCRQHRLIPYLQSGGEETIQPLTGEPRELYYRLPAQQLKFRFNPTDFTQVNSGLNRLMVGRALELLALDRSDRVLDLFCGLGNFTLPMAQIAGRVTAVEGDAGLVQRAKENARLNRIGNVSYHAADLYAGVGNEPWLRQSYDKVLLDPPRSGAWELLPWLAASGATGVVYVSCNPETLARDAAELTGRFGFRLSAAGVMDMFPHTAHIESIALFER
ncbi:MAG: 23S rRNA (uracil(1939)-C(5))-methyltransferase RlmD [Gammaproteobacteria bacterium]|nr:23S rRNA (uracil(1939)-C(5))-methyltransferase RlmD [Gammaproteobacteria bacterium]